MAGQLPDRLAYVQNSPVYDSPGGLVSRCTYFVTALDLWDDACVVGSCAILKGRFAERKGKNEFNAITLDSINSYYLYISPFKRFASFSPLSIKYGRSRIKQLNR